MKIRSTITVALAFLLGGTALAAETTGMKMEKPSDAAAEKAQTHQGVGVVKSVDAAKGTITLSHDAVPSIKWPAMTMPFKAGKDLITQVKPGDRVNFEFVAKGMDASIMAISKIK